MKTVILGAGASGLGVAWGLVEKGHKDIVILEKEAAIGGLSGSLKIGESTIDFGPHRFSPEYPELVEKVGKLLGTEWLEVSNDHAVVFKGRVYRYPPVILDFLNASTIAICVRVLSSFLWCRLRSLFASSPTVESFESIIVSRFGKALYDDVVRPMAMKVWGDPAKLDPQFAKLRFSVPTFVSWFKKMVGSSGTFNDKVFFYPRKGFQQLWDRLAEHLTESGVQIVTSATVSGIQCEGSKIKSLAYSKDGKTFHVQPDFLVSTIPTQHFVRLLKPMPVSASELLGAKFQNKGMLLVYFLIKKERTLPARVVIFPEEKFLFNRLSEQNQFSRDTVPPGHSAVLADVLAEVGTDTWNIDDTILTRKCRDTIARLGFFREEEVVETKVLRIPIAYPLPTVVREAEQTKFNSLLSFYENLICTGRFASTDYNNSHTALKKGLMAAAAIDAKQTPADWYRSAETIRKTAIRD